MTIIETKTGRLVGQSVPRKENLPLVTGSARFLDDLRLPGMVYAKILRSPVAHARIRRLDLSKARLMPGVVDAICAEDVAGKVEPWGALDIPVGEYYTFATDKLLFEGHEVAAVAAETAYEALDALDAIELEYDELPAILRPQDALLPGAPVVQETQAADVGEGNCFDVYRARCGDMERARAEAAVVVRQRFVTNRPMGASLEPHGCIADYDSFTGRLTLYDSTQSIHLVRDLLSKALHLPRNRVRVVALEVGAGFGAKAQLFPYEIIASVLSMQLGRPVHLILNRREVFLTGTCRANEVRYAQLYVSGEGKIVGYEDQLVHNVGAASMWGNQTIRIGTHIGLLPYPIPNVKVTGQIVHTNTAPAGALRGFGVPQMIWGKEQLVDMAADALGIDPVEFRLRNMIHRADCPTRTPMGHEVDSTSIDECLLKVAEAIKWDEAKQSPIPDEGIGFSVVMKYTSARHPSFDSDLSSARVRVETDGTVTVQSSDVPHGQGHATFMSQIVSDIVGVSFDKIEVSSADTDHAPLGLGTWGSRAAAVLGAAVEMAATKVRDKMFWLASHLLQCDRDDLEAGEDRVYLAASPDVGVTLETLALVAAYATHQIPEGFEAGSLEAVATYDTPTELCPPDHTGNWTVTYSSSAHAARLRVDRDTGHVEILDYVIASDSGNIINPLIVEGQQQGAFVHGYAMVFGEDLTYDEDGRVANASFKDYMAPGSMDVPDLSRVWEIPAPSLIVPGGRKGAGETSTTPVVAAIGNALYRAIGVRFTTLPVTPMDIVAALKEKERRGVETLCYSRDDPGFDADTDWPEPLPEPQEA